MNKDILEWSDITRLAAKLVRQLDPADYDVVLAVTRGGMIPGALLSEALNLRNVMTAAVMFYQGEQQALEEPHFLQFPGDALLLGKRVLIVDDVWDSGKTAVAVRERVEQAGGAPTVAVLHYKPRHSRFPDDAPDFFGEETDAWIVYPWDPERAEEWSA